MCTSQSLFSLAAAIWCTGHELLYLSDVPRCRYFQVLSGSLFVEMKIVHCLISVLCTESLPYLPTLKSLGLLKASESQIYCSSSRHRKKKKIEKMKSIVKTVIFCGQNNIPLRGKRDDNPDVSNLQGNFQALLEFRIDSGDVKLKEHLDNAPRNATYLSKTIQNEIIETVGNYIFSKIIAEVKQTRMFSIMADEAADVSNKENLSLVLRYVDSSKNIRE